MKNSIAELKWEEIDLVCGGNWERTLRLIVCTMYCTVTNLSIDGTELENIAQCIMAYMGEEITLKIIY